MPAYSHPTALPFDHIVIGAGVIGLAIARSLALTGADTLLLESEAAFGTGISSRNSEVIHAGIYYAPNSLKARFCVEGQALLTDYCEARHVSFRRTGKLLVATEADEVDALARYEERARRNGVALDVLSRAEVAVLEPALRCVAALHSPGSGILDSHGLMFALLTDFEQAGGMFARRSPVLAGRAGGDRLVLEIGGEDACAVTAPSVINCAGLQAQAVALSFEGIRSDAVPTLHHAIGHYFSLTGRSPFSRLIYPLPAKGGLGVHLTLDLAGRARFGPDISWRDWCDFRFDESRANGFYEAIRRYFPRLEDGMLTPAYTGIRPKIAGPDEPDRDFMIQQADEHGVAGLVNLFGMESPGLTSCLALAEHVRKIVRA